VKKAVIFRANFTSVPTRPNGYDIPETHRAAFLSGWNCLFVRGRACRACCGIALPEPLQRFRQRLLLYRAVAVDGVAGEDELVGVALGGQGRGHAFVRDDPVVHLVAHDVGVEQVAIAHFHPDAQRLRRAVGDEAFTALPRAAGIGIMLRRECNHRSTKSAAWSLRWR
jgi:hypothetical protein